MWDHARSWDHDDVGPRPVLAPAHDGPARSDGAEGKGHTSALRADRGR